jgi:hypothetical protein
MASPKTSDDEPIVLAVDRHHLQFLRLCFVCLRLGLLEDLAMDASQLKDPIATLKESELLRCWHQDLEDSVLVGTVDELRHYLTEYLGVIDGDNDYGRVVAEHEAFAHLVRQLPR